MKRRLIPILLALAMLVIPVTTVLAAQRFDYYTSDSGNSRFIFEDVLYGQSFTPDGAYRIESVKLALYKNGSPGDFTVSIRPLREDGKPSDEVFCQGTISDSIIPSGFGNWDWVEVPFSTAYNLASDVEYVLVTEADEPYDDYVGWINKTNTGYDGTAFRNHYWDPDWIFMSAGNTFLFETWGDTPEISDCISGCYVWWEGEPGWIQVIEPMELPGDEDIYYAIGWVNTTQETQTGHIDALVIGPNAQGIRTDAYIGQDQSCIPRSGQIVGFEPFTTDEDGTYTIYSELNYDADGEWEVQDVCPYEVFVDTNTNQFDFSADVVDCDFTSKNYLTTQKCDWERCTCWDEWTTTPYTEERDLDFDGDVDGTDETIFINTPRFALPIVEEIKTGDYETLTWGATSVCLAACDEDEVQQFTGVGANHGWISVRYFAYDEDDYNCSSFATDTMTAAYKVLGYGTFMVAFSEDLAPEPTHKYIMFWKGGDWTELSNWGILEPMSGVVFEDADAPGLQDKYKTDGIMFPVSGPNQGWNFIGQKLNVSYVGDSTGSVSYSQDGTGTDQPTFEPLVEDWDLFRGYGID